MNLEFWSVGKSNDTYIQTGVVEFTKRISNYYKTGWKIIPPLKNAAGMNEQELKKNEGNKILSLLKKDDYMVSLDQKGKHLSSEGLADFIKIKSNESVKSLVFVIGGAFGLDKAVLDNSKFRWSLSHLTFPHQLVRLILAEQVYRACTIIKNEKYHHK